MDRERVRQAVARVLAMACMGVTDGPDWDAEISVVRSSVEWDGSMPLSECFGWGGKAAAITRAVAEAWT